MTKPILTQQYLKECLHYDPETGVFTWLDRPESHFKERRRYLAFKTRCEGKIASRFKPRAGYIYIAINEIGYRAHRLAFLYMTGQFPDQVDHINHVRSDNRWSNLRSVDVQTNNKNVSLRRTNDSGCAGVTWSRQFNKWRARINKEHLGLFDDVNDAIKARKAREPEFGFHQNHGARPINAESSPIRRHVLS